VTTYNKILESGTNKIQQTLYRTQIDRSFFRKMILISYFSDLNELVMIFKSWPFFIILKIFLCSAKQATLGSRDQLGG
jgi:hypothetical protein